MTAERDLGVRSAEVVLPCRELDATLAFFRERLGFRIDSIFPADDPRIAVVSGHGTRLRLERGRGGDPGRLLIRCGNPPAAGKRVVTAPNGTVVELVDADPPVDLPPLRPEIVVSHATATAGWNAGRAGMCYRDLIPGRQGGRVVASHIRIPDGGPVPDYVHFHEVRFQMIFCRAGAVRVVYEDQGEPFWLQAGDCVLQPPRIRHEVLECTPGLEVIELGYPAEHATHADHGLALPTPAVRPEREFDGQRFVHHVAATASWAPWRVDGFVCRDTGIATATRGIADVRVVRPTIDPVASGTLAVEAELLFGFVLAGGVRLQVENHGSHMLSSGDGFALPSGTRHRIERWDRDLELLVVEVAPDPDRSSRPAAPDA